ncbi:MAG TPA: hypothetical protein VF017_02465 [Thermoanaerobaculia bacterium]|nr:hypothetical protein [Thermoanaerobaculia bacterium]
MSVLETFEEKKALWLVPLTALLVFAGALVFFQMNYAGQSAGLEKRVADREAELAKLQAETARLREIVDRGQANHARIEELYRDRFATRRQRLTQVTEEVKDLARRAGLDPRTLRYPETRIEDFGLVERRFDFNVQGTYAALRTFLNLLELSPAFLTLEQIRVSQNERAPGILSLDLELSTLFADEVIRPAVAEVAP